MVFRGVTTQPHTCVYLRLRASGQEGLGRVTPAARHPGLVDYKDGFSRLIFVHILHVDWDLRGLILICFCLAWHRVLLPLIRSLSHGLSRRNEMLLQSYLCLHLLLLYVLSSGVTFEPPTRICSRYTCVWPRLAWLVYPRRRVHPGIVGVHRQIEPTHFLFMCFALIGIVCQSGATLSFFLFGWDFPVSWLPALLWIFCRSPGGFDGFPVCLCDDMLSRFWLTGF